MEPLRFNTLEVRLAETEAEIDAAQALRYRIFYDEMGANPTPNRKKLARDVDPYDEICDHLLVIDTARGTPAAGAGSAGADFRQVRAGPVHASRSVTHGYSR